MKKWFALLLLGALSACSSNLDDCRQNCQDALYEQCYDYCEDDSATDCRQCDNVEADCDAKCNKQQSSCKGANCPRN